jgi:hypothetical protein
MADNDYILFYSNKCLHSKELLNLLYKDPQLNQKFTKINIDNTNVKIPPYVKSVPTAIITANGSPSLLVGSAIFKWYNQMHTKTVEKEGIQDWDPLTMTGYSDGFSYLSENSDVMKKSFSFISDKDGIITPDEKNYSNDGNKGDKGQPKTKLDGDFESFMNQRKFDVPASIPKI